MKETKFLPFLVVLLFCWGSIYAQEGLVQEFEIKNHDMTLERLALPGTPFDKVGRKFAVLGDESGTFEAWAYPLKILRNFEISFFIGSSTRAVKAGGQGERKDILNVYKKLQESTLRIQTPEPELDLAFHWAKVAFDNLIVDNPTLGKGLVAGLGVSGSSGRPGFGWFFGGDAYINSFSFMSYGAHETVRNILAFTQKWQRDDGKMSHELSQAEGYIDWWIDYHYGYIHGDTTPYYITAMYDYMQKSGDIDFIKKSWESLKKAYIWCLSTDANGDALMDNKQAGLGALEYGALTGIETDIYLAAVWVRAAMSMQRMAEAVGDKTLDRTSAQQFKQAKKAFEEKFWDKDSQFYVYAFNTEGKHVQEISPWNAVGLMWELGNPQHIEQKPLLSAP